jgi:hypothetical protein
MHYRQGDVLIERIRMLPEEVKAGKPENGKIILALGEVTGHAHVVPAELAKSFVDENGGLFIEVEEEAEVLHEEHATLRLPAGIYRITHQREYTPEAIRNVAD